MKKLSRKLWVFMLIGLGAATILGARLIRFVKRVGEWFADLTYRIIKR